MPWVQLTRNRQGTMRRLVRDAAGKPVINADGTERWLVFPPKQPVLLKLEDIPAIKDDLGVSLMAMELTADGKFIPVQLEEGETLEAAPVPQAVAGQATAPPGITNAVTESGTEPSPDPASPPLPELNDVLEGNVNPKSVQNKRKP